MTKEKKQLLILCAMLPYDTIVNVDNGKYREDMKLRPCHIADFNILGVRPYLRPMSSMTDAEKIDFQYITERWMYDASYSISDSFDWLNAHHFDYRGMIDVGLALEAPEGMY